MSNDKTYPSHTISFAEKTIDGQGHEKLGKPVEVATVWPRKNGKQGGLIDWHISPQNLKDGAYFMLDNERQQGQTRQADAPPQQESQFDRVDARQQNRDQEQGR